MVHALVNFAVALALALLRKQVDLGDRTLVCTPPNPSMPSRIDILMSRYRKKYDQKGMVQRTEIVRHQHLIFQRSICSNGEQGFPFPQMLEPISYILLSTPRHFFLDDMEHGHDIADTTRKYIRNGCTFLFSYMIKR